MIATRVGETRNYITKADRKLPAEEQTTFVLQSLSAGGRAEIQDAMVGLEEQPGDDDTPDREITVQRPGTALLVACRLGIKDWTNLRDEDGNEVPCKKTWTRLANGEKRLVLQPQSLERIADAFIELGNEVMTLNRLDEGAEDDEGNEPASATPTDSASSPTSPSSAEPVGKARPLTTRSSARTAAAGQ